MSKTFWNSSAFLVLLWASFAAADDGPASPLSVSCQFSSHGTVRMYLSAGSYSIRPSDTEQIHVMGTVDYPANPNSLKAELNNHGSEATLVTHGPHNNSHFTIDVPRHSNLIIRLSAGEIEIQRVEGNLDISSHAGDIVVEVPSASEYRSVDASVYAGDLNAPAFGASKGGLFRTLHWTGTGAYHLHAHVGAGELSLQAEK